MSKVHLINSVSPLFLACGIGWFKIGKYLGRVHKTSTDVYGSTGLAATCERCKKTLLYRGDNTNAIKKLMR